MAWTVRGAWSARCRCLLRTVCRSRVQTSWHHARTCPLNRQGTAAAHAHACFSKGCSSTASRTPLQRLWGNKAHTYRLARTYAHTHTHTYTHACAQTHTNTKARDYSQAHTRTYTCTNTQTRARAHIQTLKHTGRHTRIHARTPVLLI